jgi:pilus assembly protein CpaF
VYVERFGRIERTDVRFRDADHIVRVIERIAARVGRRIDTASPMADLRLPDGSRVNATLPPATIDGPTISIRRFGRRRLRRDDLLTLGTLSPEMLEFLVIAVRARKNILISGGTGAGKSTLLGVLAEAIPDSERIVTIEDTAELSLEQEHVVRMETRPANIEGKGRILARDLLINALRMRPDRIIVGEVRGEEALDMLQAMNTGHDGSLTTIHANSPRDALYRLDTMVAMANLNIPEKAIRQQVASAVNLIVQVTRLTDGTRRVTSISEITGMEQDVITMQEIFAFQRTGLDKEGRVLGLFKATGIRPKCADLLATAGHTLPMDMFEHAQPLGGGRRNDWSLS